MPSPRENLEPLLRQRYGTDTGLPGPADGALEPILANLLAHRTVRAYDARPVEEAHLRWIVQAAQSAATSSNLQAWSVVAVSDPARKARLGPRALKARRGLPGRRVLMVLLALPVLPVLKARKARKARKESPELSGQS